MLNKATQHSGACVMRCLALQVDMGCTKLACKFMLLSICAEYILIGQLTAVVSRKQVCCCLTLQAMKGSGPLALVRIESDDCLADTSEL